MDSQDKDKKSMMKQVITDNLKRLVLINMTVDDLAELYNQKVGKDKYYNVCDNCHKLTSTIVEELSECSYDPLGNFYHYYYCPNCKTDK